MMSELLDTVSESADPWQLVLVGFATVALTVLFWPVLQRVLPRLLPLALTLSIIACWGSALLGSADRQPAGYMLRDVTIAPAAQRVVLGRTTLMQNPGLSGSADERHVQLERGSAGWHISNVSARRRLRLEYADLNDPQKSVAFDSARVFLRAGDVLQLSAHGGHAENIQFEAVGTDQLALRVTSPADPAGGRAYSILRSRGRIEARNARQAALAPCEPDARGPTALYELLRWGQDVLRAEQERTVLQFGGDSECLNRRVAAVPIRNAPFSAATLIHRAGVGFAVALGRDPAAKLVRGSQEIWLAAVQHDLRTQIGGIDMTLRSFVAGYTKYAVERPNPPVRGVAFRIMPIEKSHRVIDGKTCNVEATVVEPGEVGLPFAARCRNAPAAGVEWRAHVKDWTSALAGARALARWWGRTLYATAAAVGARVADSWLLIATLILVVGTIAAGTYRLKRLGRTPLFEAPRLGGKLVGFLFAIAAVVMLAGYLGWKSAPATATALPLAPWPALLAWGLAAVAVATARGAGLLDGLIMGVWTALIAVGHVALVELTFASGELRNLRFADDTTAAIAAAAGLVILASQIGPRWLAGFMRTLVVPVESGRFPLPRGMAACLFLILLALAGWTAFGTEAGIAGVLQPSEIVKTLTVLVLAAAVTLALERDRGPDSRLTRLLPARGRERLGAILPLVGATALAAGLLASGLRLTIVTSGIFAAALEAIVLVAALTLLVIVLQIFRNYFWRSFLTILVLLGVILFVPVLRNDLSPFLVLATTSAATFLIVVLIHWAAIASERLQLSRPQRAPPPDVSRPRPVAGPGLDRLRRSMWLRWRHAAARFVARPEPWMIGICLATVFILWSAASAALEDARRTREALMDLVGGGLNKPVERVISWIEFNGNRDKDGVIGVEFADVGLQVARSRDVITASACRAGTGGDPQSEAGPGMLPRLVRTAADTARSVAEAAVDRIAAEYLPNCRQAAVHERTPIDIAVRMPAIQNDFVSTWLIARFGRVGAAGIVLLQCLLLTLMLFAGFSTIKWTPGHLHDRPAASVAGYATIGFAVMLGLQWSISWLNALGLVPVMGQPSTFLSHGPSHGLLFGVPAVLAALLALRLRSAFRLPDPIDKPDDVPWRYITLSRR